MSTTIRRSLVIIALACTALAHAGLARQGARQRLSQQDLARCQEWVDAIAKVNEELTAIAQRRPPFDRMSQEDLDGNIRYRRREIDILEGRRSGLGCPGARPLTDVSGGGGGTGAGTGTGRGASGGAGAGRGGATPSWSDEQIRDLMQNHCKTIPGAQFYYSGGYTCDLPGDDSGTLRVGSPPDLETPEALGQAEFTDGRMVNDILATAGSGGEDMAGYWGATVAWRRRGRLFNVSVIGPYPEDSSEAKRRELYQTARDKALQLAQSLDRALRQ